MSNPKDKNTAPEVLDPQTVGLLGAAIAPAALAPERVADLRARVMAGVAGTTQVLRAEDGATSHAPAFLQPRASEPRNEPEEPGGEARRPRRRRPPRSFDAGEAAPAEADET